MNTTVETERPGTPFVLLGALIALISFAQSPLLGQGESDEKAEKSPLEQLLAGQKYRLVGPSRGGRVTT